MEKYMVISCERGNRNVLILYENIADLEFAEILVQKELKSAKESNNNKIFAIVPVYRELNTTEEKLADSLASRYRMEA